MRVSSLSGMIAICESNLWATTIAIGLVYAAIKLLSLISPFFRRASPNLLNRQSAPESTEPQQIIGAVLTDSEQLQRVILESANYSIISTSVNGTILSFNKTAQNWLGYTEAEVVGSKTPEIIHDVDEVISKSIELSQELGTPIAPGFEVFVAKARRGETNEQEWTYIRKDGSRFPILLSVTALRDADNHLTGFLGIGSDITQRKQSDAALRQSKDELEARVAERTTELLELNQQLAIELRERQQAQEALQSSQEQLKDALQTLNFHFENSPLGVVEWNRDFQVIRWSGSAEKIFGWSANEVLGKHIYEWQFVFIEDVERIHLEVAGLLDGSKERSVCKNRNYHKDGSIVHCEWYNSALLDEFGKMKSVLSLAFDVTDRDRVERMKNEFISVVSHELRTPLTSIHGSLGMLASGLLPPESTKATRLIEIAAGSTERLVRLINDILDIERIESGKVLMSREICAVGDLIGTAVNTVQSLADRANVRIVVKSISTYINVDGDRIVQALTNLLSNAIKFSPPGQAIDCIVESQGDYIIFQVADRGRGIPPDKLETIFERFQQVDSSDSRNHEGTGLGLAICRSIIQQHSGEIWVESLLGYGSTFCFKLPVVTYPTN